MRERLAIAILHDQVIGPVVLADVVERADVGVIERRDRLRLALEPDLQHRVVRELRRQNLHRNDPSESRVFRAIDLTHTAGADAADDFVRPEASTGPQVHDVCAKDTTVARLAECYRGRAECGSHSTLVTDDIGVPQASSGPLTVLWKIHRRYRKIQSS